MKFINILIIGIMTFAGTLILLKQKISTLKAGDSQYTGSAN